MALVSAVHAEEAPEPVGAAVGLLLMAEAMDDAAIGRVYRNTSLSGEGRGALTFGSWLEAGVSVGYRRMAGLELSASGLETTRSSWLWYAPLSATIGGAWTLRDLTAFANGGPSVVFWAEEAKPESGAGYSGGKLGFVVDAGLRMPVPGVGPSLFAPDEGLRGLDIEADIGYRHSLRSYVGCAEAPCGLDFSALRIGAGLRARF